MHPRENPFGVDAPWTVGYVLRLRGRGRREGERGSIAKGEAFLLTVGAFFLTVKLLCLQSLKAPY